MIQVWITIWREISTLLEAKSNLGLILLAQTSLGTEPLGGLEPALFYIRENRRTSLSLIQTKGGTHEKVS